MIPKSKIHIFQGTINYLPLQEEDVKGIQHKEYYTRMKISCKYHFKILTCKEWSQAVKVIFMQMTM